MLEFTDQNFDQEVVQAELPVMVDFWATWCMPCLKIAPLIEEFAEKYQGRMKFGKLNVENHQRIAQQYGIRSIPTLLIFKNGKIISQIVGMMPGRKMEEKIREVV